LPGEAMPRLQLVEPPCQPLRAPRRQSVSLLFGRQPILLGGDSPLRLLSGFGLLLL
jgi:hypothetical protein